MNARSQEIATRTEKACYKRKTLTSTRRITYLATLVAMALTFKLLGNWLTFGSLKFSIVYIPWMIAGMIMGPLGGATVAFATDILGQLILPAGGGGVIPLIVLSNTLFGLISGLVFMAPKVDNRVKLVIATAAVITVCTMGLSTYALADFYKRPLSVQFVLRIPQALIVCINAAAIAFTIPLLGKMGLLGGVPIPKKRIMPQAEAHE